MPSIVKASRSGYAQKAYPGHTSFHLRRRHCHRLGARLFPAHLARFVLHQDLQTLLRCHMQAFSAIGGVPLEILYDRMKTALTGEDADGHIIYNRSLIALGQHYGFDPRVVGPPGQNQEQGRTAVSSWLAASAISTTSTPSSTIGSPPSPMCGFTARRSGSLQRPSPPSNWSCRGCPLCPLTRCSSLNACQP